MHYLEDYLEIIELLPAELKSSLTQARDLDATVQNELDVMNDRTKTFFTLSRKSKTDVRDQQFQTLCEDYDRINNTSLDKAKIVTHISDLLDRYMRRLEQDLSRFTIELEADTAGITELLEQRSYLLDRPPSPERPQTGQKRTRQGLHQDDLLNGEFDDYSPSASTRTSPVPGRGMKYSRRERLNVSSENENDFLTDLEELTSPSSFYAGTGGKPPMSFVSVDSRSQKKRSSTTQHTEILQEPTSWVEYVDPNEPRYCLCNQVSYGEMVGCDNAECPIEWFHYDCVGITDPPKGKWYCPKCTISMKTLKKGNRK